MERWEILFETTRPEQVEFNQMLEREVTLMKFTAIIAKQIVLASEEHNTSAELLFNGVGVWLKKIKESGIEIPTGTTTEVM